MPMQHVCDRALHVRRKTQEWPDVGEGRPACAQSLAAVRAPYRPPYP